MSAYDALPPDLRRWMRDAKLPWSPQSCLRIWNKALSQGQDPVDALRRLDLAEQTMLSRDQVSETAA